MELMEELAEESELWWRWLRWLKCDDDEVEADDMGDVEGLQPECWLPKEPKCCCC